MAKPPSLNPFLLAAESWAFFRRQPALLSVLLWLVILPSAAIEAMDAYWPESDVPSVRGIGELSFVVAMIVMLFLMLWGLACTLLVARRMLQSKAGRSRTSFSAVRRESIKLILPLFFTSLLRGIITVYWALPYLAASLAFVMLSRECQLGLRDMADAASPRDAMAAFYRGCSPLLLLLPLLIFPIVYCLRTFFWGAVVAGEKLKYRDALRRSRDVVKGRGWPTLGALLGLGLLLFVPAQIPVGIAWYVETRQEIVFPLLDELTGSVTNAVAGMLFTLGTVELYRRLRARTVGAHEVVPEGI